jgi:hypothetical protein
LRLMPAARAALSAVGQSTGEVCFEHDHLRVHYTQPVEIHWDQAVLHALARRIAESGDSVENFLDVRFSVPEARLQRWGAPLQAMVARARQEILGAPRFVLAYNPFAATAG